MQGLIVIFALTIALGGVLGRGVRQVAPGGWTVLGTNDDEAEAAALSALSILQEKSNYPGNYRLLKLYSVKEQVVAGKNYEIQLSYDITQCKPSNPSFNNAKTCPGQHGAKCTITLFVQVWSQTQEITQMGCVPLQAPVAHPHWA